MTRRYKKALIFATLAALLQSSCLSPSGQRSCRSARLLGDPGGSASASTSDPNTPKPAGLPELTAASGLNDYLVYAALNNPALQSAFNRWKAALERIPQVTALPDPRFTYRYFIQEVETRVGAQRQAFEISQVFPWFGKLDLRGDMARAAAAAARQRYQAARLKLFYAVKDAYYEYFYLSRAIAVTQEHVNLEKYLERVARTRYKTAAVSQPAVVRAQVELGKLEDRLRTLQDLRHPLAARLNAALNRPVAAELPWPRRVDITNIAVTDEQLLTWLKENNPELKALEFEINRQKRRMELAGKDYYPDIALGVSYIDTADSIGGRQPRDDGQDPIAAMVSVNLPLWHDKYAAGVRQAQAAHYAAMHDRLEKSNSLGAALKLVLYRFRDAQRKIDLYRDTLLPKAEQSLKVTESAFRAGQGTFLDLVDAQRVLLEFQLAYERARADHQQRLAELEMLVGRPIPTVGYDHDQDGPPDTTGRHS